MVNSTLADADTITPEATESPSGAIAAGAVEATLEHDYFVERDGVRYAGGHLLIDMWGASHLDDPDVIESAMTEAVLRAGATVLHAHVHRFSPYGGVTGVIVLAESHLTFHTWPEREFAAIDIFMCGECNPYDALPVIRRVFKPRSFHVSEQKRGLIP